MKGKRIIEFTLVIVFILAGVILARYLITTKRPPRRLPGKEMVLPVKAQKVQLKKTTIRTIADGEVLPKRVIQIVPQVPGRVVYVAEELQKGGIMREGQVLIRIEEKDYKLRLIQAEAELKRAEAELSRIKADQEAAIKEWHMLNPDTPPPPLVKKEPQLKAAEAAVLAARASLEKAKLDLERTTIRAPFDCIVLEETVDTGQYIFSGQPVAKLASIDTAEVRVFISDKDLRFIKVPGLNTKDTKGSAASVEATIEGKTYSWKGEITRSEPIDPKTRRLPLIIEVHGPYSTIPPLSFGLYVKVTINGPEVPDGVLVSKRAIEWDDELRPYVWSIDQNSRARITPVRLLQEYATEVLLQGGLKDGQFVILDPPTLLTDGSMVKVIER